MIYIGKFDSKEVARAWIKNCNSELTAYDLTEKDGKYHLEIELNSNYDDINKDYQTISCWNCCHRFEVSGDFICEVDHDYVKQDRSEGCDNFLRDVMIIKNPHNENGEGKIYFITNTLAYK